MMIIKLLMYYFGGRDDTTSDQICMIYNLACDLQVLLFPICFSLWAFIYFVTTIYIIIYSILLFKKVSDEGLTCNQPIILHLKVAGRNKNIKYYIRWALGFSINLFYSSNLAFLSNVP